MGEKSVPYLPAFSGAARDCFQLEGRCAGRSFESPRVELQGGEELPAHPQHWFGWWCWRAAGTGTWPLPGANTTDCFAAPEGRAKGRAELTGRVTFW